MGQEGEGLGRVQTQGGMPGCVTKKDATEGWGHGLKGEMQVKG